MTEQGGYFAFSVDGGKKPKRFAWVWLERLRPGKPRLPNPDVVAVSVADLTTKDIILGLDAAKFFTEPHYSGYPAVLIRLSAVTQEELEGLLTGAWRCKAPKALVREFDAR